MPFRDGRCPERFLGGLRGTALQNRNAGEQVAYLAAVRHRRHVGQARPVKRHVLFGVGEEGTQLFRLAGGDPVRRMPLDLLELPQHGQKDGVVVVGEGRPALTAQRRTWDDYGRLDGHK